MDGGGRWANEKKKGRVSRGEKRVGKKQEKMGATLPCSRREESN